MTTLISKIGFPVIILLVGFAVGMVTSKKLEKAVKIPTFKCPDCKCPEPPNSIDFEKVKNFKGTLRVDQNYYMEMSGDSLILSRIREAMKAELENFKVRKCR
jgi:hypothetical protein